MLIKQKKHIQMMEFYLIELIQFSEAANQVEEASVFKCGKELKERVDK